MNPSDVNSFCVCSPKIGWRPRRCKCPTASGRRRRWWRCFCRGGRPRSRRPWRGRRLWPRRSTCWSVLVDYVWSSVQVYRTRMVNVGLVGLDSPPISSFWASELWNSQVLRHQTKAFAWFRPLEFQFDETQECPSTLRQSAWLEKQACPLYSQFNWIFNSLSFCFIHMPIDALHCPYLPNLNSSREHVLKSLKDYSPFLRSPYLRHLKRSYASRRLHQIFE